MSKKLKICTYFFIIIKIFKKISLNKEFVSFFLKFNYDYFTFDAFLHLCFVVNLKCQRQETRENLDH